jgi:hypothetical protein
VLALGCESAQRAGETIAFTLNPFGSIDVLVVATEEHGPYLFAGVSGGPIDLRFVTPRTETCLHLLQAETSVRYAKEGNFGRFLRDDDACDAIGTLSLVAWRNRQPRARTRSAVPRSTVRYSVVHRDPQYVFLRGRFPLASRIGIPSAFDLVAIVPDDEPCRVIASRSEASLEFRVAGREAFRLLTGGPPCLPAGFAMPVDAVPRAE